MHATVDVPVLLIVFNRPEMTQRMFDAVRAAPRPDYPDDLDRCEVRTRFKDRNLGCKRGVGTAIDWFLSEADAGIIVEDDCVPTMDFVRFCAELPDRYRDAAEVMMIGGHNPLGAWDGGKASHRFDLVYTSSAGTPGTSDGRSPC
jgi:hypothetical protein